ncbi:MAG: hypothetical protein ABIX01_02835 [Chitinophagaceae bacterium]
MAGKQAVSFERTSEGLVVQFPGDAPEDSYTNSLNILQLKTN